MSTDNNPSYCFSLAMALVGLGLALPTVIFNVLLLVTIFRDPHGDLRNKPSSCLVLNLCVCDLLSGLLSGLGGFSYDVALLSGASRERLGAAVILIVKAAVFTNVVGSCTVVAMAFDRWYAIASPLKHIENRHRKMMKRFCIAVWIYALLFGGLAQLGLPRDVFIMLFYHLHVSVPLLILAVFSWKTFRAVLRANRNVQNISTHTNDQLNSAFVRRERKVISAFAIIVALFYITYVPLFVLQNVKFFWPSYANSVAFPYFVHAADRFTLLNCVLDPFIYAWRIPKYKRAFKAVFCACVNQGNDIIRTGTTN